MEGPVLVTVAVAILAFGVISRRAERTALTPPIFFVALGLGAQAFGLVHLEVSEPAIHLLAEITLVIILFTDASRIRFEQVRQGGNLPARLLAIGMPLTIVLGAGIAAGLFPQLTFWEAALLATVLAPTDAALGQAVVSSPKVPIRIRQALNVESGLNDGIALPLVLVFLSACASAIPELGGTGYWLRFAALQVTLGPLTGALVGWLGGRAVAASTARGWMNHSFQHLSSLGLALLSFAGANAIGGNGFIAAFVAGLVLGNTVSDQVCECLYDFAEAEGQFLALLVFLVFGAVLLPHHLDHVSWQAVLYGLLSLTVVRILPVAVSLLGLGLRWPTVLFLGWFGPRGIASILFGLVVVADSQLAGGPNIFATVLVTVLLSVLLHGATAYAGASWYARCTETFDLEDPEKRGVAAEVRVRIRHADSPPA
ncbi:MAG: cation:proton antiporter [Acidobacteriota bacterium]